jgi:peptide subunit release factor RF-3
VRSSWTTYGQRLGGTCLDFTDPDPEEIAMCSEEALEKYAGAGRLTDGDIAELVRARALVPCFFGSGLKLDGVAEFLQALDRYTLQPDIRRNLGRGYSKLPGTPRETGSPS